MRRSFPAFIAICMTLAMTFLSFGAASAQGQPRSGPQRPRAITPDTAEEVVSPHTRALDSALAATLKGVRDLRATLQRTDEMTSERARQIDSGLRTVSQNIDGVLRHRSMLADELQRFPGVRMNRDFVAMMAGLELLDDTNREWQAKLRDQAYVRDKERLAIDLAELDQELSFALINTREFNAAVGPTMTPDTMREQRELQGQ